MKIQVTVAIDEKGNWCANGFGDVYGPAKNSGRWASDGLPSLRVPHHFVYIDADVPLPSGPVVVEGKVVE